MIKNKEILDKIIEVIPNYSNSNPICQQLSDRIIRTETEYNKVKRELDNDINSIFGDKRVLFGKISINKYYHGIKLIDCDTDFVVSDEELIKIKYRLGFKRVLINYSEFMTNFDKLDFYKKNSIFGKDGTIEMVENYIVI